MSHASTILAIETATPIGSVALWHQDQLQHISLKKPHNQAAQLLPSINELLEKAAIDYSDIDILATTVGPGSFTGIRIGLSVAQTITMSVPNITAYGFTTLEAMASISQSAKLLATLNAGKGQIYCQPFYQGKALADITLTSPEAMLKNNEHTIIGNGHSLLPATSNIAAQAPELPDASMMIRALLDGYTPHKRELVPLYVRAPDAEISTKPLL